MEKSFSREKILDSEKSAFFDNLISKLALYCHQTNLKIKNDRGLYNNIIEQSRNKEKMSRSIKLSTGP